MKTLIITLCLSLILIVGFENCGQITLQPPQVSSASISGQHSYNVHFCLSAINGVQYQMITAPIVLNLNALPDPILAGSYLSDSDMDGVSDSQDTNPLNNHSPTTAVVNGVNVTQTFSDYLCFVSHQCPGQASSSCDDKKTYYQPGITECDLQTYTNIKGDYNIFDSNFNGIPDYIELIRGLSPISLNDPLESSPQIFAQANPIDNDSTCVFPNTNYEISYPDSSLPFVPVQNYNDTYKAPAGYPANYNLSHQENENIIYTAIIIESKGIVPTQYYGFLHLDRIQDPNFIPKTSGAPTVITTDVNINSADFFKIGPWSQQ